MSNIKIDIVDNGITTLATAGKYCDRNVDIEVNVPSSGGGGDIEVEPIVLTGDCQYSCAGALASKYIELFGDTVSTQNIFDSGYMFNDYKNDSIPFELNYSNTSTSDISNTFQSTQLKSLPAINYVKPSAISYLFAYSQFFREIPNDYFDNFDFNYLKSLTSAYSGSCSYICRSCASLRKMPLSWLNNMNPNITPSYSFYNGGFTGCYVLDELSNIPVPFTTTWTSNAFSLADLFRIKNFTFETNSDNTPKTVQWKQQTIDLAKVGHCDSNVVYRRYVTTYFNSGITTEKEVNSAETYQALKEDPDWYAYSSGYSRYNHDSAVNTINSLPDTSAYLTTAGGTNTIKFQGTAGALTDGGAINTLTAEEIAVATARGWTVTLK